MKYIIFKYATRPVIAIPLDSSLQMLRVSVKALPEHTFKRKAFKLFALCWASAVWLGRRLGLRVGVHLKSVDQELVQRIQYFYPGAAVVVPIWSLVPGRFRSYYRIFDSAAREVAFAKASINEPGRSRLQIEARALQTYADAQTFECPRLLRLDVTDVAVLLLTTALAPKSRLLHAAKTPFPSAIHAEICNRVTATTIAKVRQADWYRCGLDANAGNRRFSTELAVMDPADLVSLAPAHGDFGSENFFADPTGRVFLIDWEHYSSEAPLLTDEVGYWIGRHHRDIQSGRSGVVKDFILAFRAYPSKDILLALVYLSAFDVADAIRLAALWKN